MNTHKPSTWLAQESGTGPDADHGSAPPTVRVQLRLVHRQWLVEVERDGWHQQLDGLQDLSRYLDRLAMEAPTTPLRGLR